jgi:hypothetical protein
MDENLVVQFLKEDFYDKLPFCMLDRNKFLAYVSPSLSLSLSLSFCFCFCFTFSRF